jgi:hypothetical protein
MIEQGLGGNGIMIKSHANGFVAYDYGEWMGSLSAVNNESMYMINVNAPHTLSLTGDFTLPAQHPITLVPGWTWMGYPMYAYTDINEALSNLNPTNNDLVKTQTGFATYDEIMGWTGTLNTLNPGMGLMYHSLKNQTMSFVYTEGSKGDALVENITAEGNHYRPNASAYPYTMNMIAVVELEGVEARNGEFEVSAFVNNECRGSVRLLYVEALERYLAFLTVAGDEAATLTMKLVDLETGMEYIGEQHLEFEPDAIVGSLKHPVMLRFNATTTQCDIYLLQYELYPNPVKGGEVVKLILNGEVNGDVRVEVLDALGTVVSKETMTQIPASVRAPKTSGVYMIKVITDDHRIYGCKLIVK